MTSLPIRFLHSYPTSILPSVKSLFSTCLQASCLFSSASITLSAASAYPLHIIFVFTLKRLTKMSISLLFRKERLLSQPRRRIPSSLMRRIMWYSLIRTWRGMLEVMCSLKIVHLHHIIIIAVDRENTAEEHATL